MSYCFSFSRTLFISVYGQLRQNMDQNKRHLNFELQKKLSLDVVDSWVSKNTLYFCSIKLILLMCCNSEKNVPKTILSIFFFKVNIAQNSYWHIFKGDWSQLKKRSEIKSPLKHHKNEGNVMQQA